jgi:hypothetical protein
LIFQVFEGEIGRLAGVFKIRLIGRRGFAAAGVGRAFARAIGAARARLAAASGVARFARIGAIAAFRWPRRAYFSTLGPTAGARLLIRELVAGLALRRLVAGGAFAGLLGRAGAFLGGARLAGSILTGKRRLLAAAGPARARTIAVAFALRVGLLIADAGRLRLLILAAFLAGLRLFLSIGVFALWHRRAALGLVWLTAARFTTGFIASSSGAIAALTCARWIALRYRLPPAIVARLSLRLLSIVRRAALGALRSLPCGIGPSAVCSLRSFLALLSARAFFARALLASTLLIRAFLTRSFLAWRLRWIATFAATGRLAAWLLFLAFAAGLLATGFLAASVLPAGLLSCGLLAGLLFTARLPTTGRLTLGLFPAGLFPAGLLLAAFSIARGLSGV